MAQLGHSYFKAYDDVKGWGNTTYFSYWNEFDRPNPSVKYLETVILTLLAIISFIINIIFIAFFISCPKLRSVTNICIVNVCIAGIVTIPFIIMIGVTRIQAQWEYGNIGCHATMMALMVMASTTIWTLTLISIERFMKIVLPHKHQISHKKALALIAGVAWILPLVSDLPLGAVSVQASPVNTSSGEAIICMVHTPKLESGFRLSLLMFFIVCGIHYIAPIIIMSVCYGKIMSKLRETEKAIAKHRQSVYKKGEASTAERRKRAIKMLIIMLVVTIVMWMPLFFMLAAVTIDTVLEKYNVSSQGFIWIAASISLNTIINPLLYTLTSTQHRRQLRHWLKFNNNLVSNFSISADPSTKNMLNGRPKEQESSFSQS